MELNLQLLFFLIFTMKILCQIKILAPKELSDIFNGTEIKAGFANFGHFPYGQVQTGILYLNKTSPYNNIFNAKMIDSPFYLIDGEECDNNNLNWINQVERIQQNGGQLVLIALNESVNSIERYFYSQKDYKINPYLSNINRITIPSMVINKKDADILKKYYNQFSNIILEIKYEYTGKNNIVTFDVFLDSGNIDVYKVMFRMQKFLYEIKKNLKFIPHFITYSRNRFNNSIVRFENCLGNGKYCIDAPSNKAKSILFENIRQACVYQYSEDKEDISIFYKYVEIYYKNCLNDGKKETKDYNNDSCSEKVIKRIGLNETSISSCVEINTSQNLTNSILEKDSKSKRVYYQLLQAKFAINGKYSHAQKPFQLLKSICMGLIGRPSMCFREGFIRKRLNTAKKRSYFLFFFFVSSIGFIFINIMIIIFCIIRSNRSVALRVNNNNFKDEVKEIASKYIQLKESNSSIVLSNSNEIEIDKICQPNYNKY